jgi:salicylate hydroxylase
MKPPLQRPEPRGRPSGAILIAGAGIGGLTAALSLARLGYGVTLLEQRTRLEEVGAGIQLSPNACHVLTQLGLAHPVSRAAAEPERLVVRRGETGAKLADMALGETMRQRFGAPYLLIHRADLQSLLLDQVRADPAIRLAFGRLVSAVETGPDGVRLTAQTASGEEVYEGVALIGADGLWSRVARALGDRSQPAFFGHVAWRGQVPAAEAPAAFLTRQTGLWIGRGAHAVHYPLRHGRLVNVVAVMPGETAEPGWSRPGDSARARRMFSAWSPELVQLLEKVADWQVWSLFDRAPRRRWSRGCVTLLGDAAHPVLPFLAQGGALAIEDAAVLAASLAASPHDIPAALAAYEAQRRTRTTKVQQAARQNGRIYHLGGPAAFARDLVLGGMGGARLLDRYDWLYRWQPEPDAAVPGLIAPVALQP